MAQPHLANFLVSPKTVDQLAYSILDNIGKAIPAQRDRHSAASQKPGHLTREPSRGDEFVVPAAQKVTKPEIKAAIEALFGVKVHSVSALPMKGQVKRSRGLRHRKFAHADNLIGSKRVNAGAQAKVRHVVKHQLEENVHAAVRQALEQIDVHIISNAELELLAQVKRIQLQRSQERIETVVELLLDGYDPTTATIAKIDQQNAEARVRFLKEIKTMTSLQLAEMNGHTAKNAAQTANRWKSKDRIFGVPFQGQNLFPAFQFRDGQPLQVVADILGVLPPDMTEWQTAFWFVSSNPWLDGKAPYRCLDERAKVVEAAKQEGFL